MSEANDQPERHMAARALVPGAVAALLAFAVGYAVNGTKAGVCALLGVVIVTVSFAVYVLVLGRARRVSAGAMQAATLGGWLVRLGIIVGSLAVVSALDGDVAAFGFAAIGAAIAVAMYEAWVVLTGKLEPSKVEADGSSPAGSSPAAESAGVAPAAATPGAAGNAGGGA
jgi:chromate transport protein ChrA